jgi:hypothetical protein
MNTEPSKFDEEAYKKGLLGPVIRFGEKVSDQYKGWAQKQYKETPDDGINLKTN